MRKGPDGFWYVIGGNDSGINSHDHVTGKPSPVTQPEAGALLRLSPDGKRCEVVAHGLRNPYRFSFDRGESIHTENSYKYSVPEFERLATSAGFEPAKCWTDPRGWFGLFGLLAA